MNYSVILLKLFFLFTLYFPSNAQIVQSPKWFIGESPIYNDLTHFYINKSGILFTAGEQILEYRNSGWEKLSPQPPEKISNIFITQNESIFITHDTEYQESNLYHFNGSKWEQISHPLANNIYAFYFENNLNGYIGGFGELAKLHNGSWEYLPFPYHDIIDEIVVDKHNNLWVHTIFNGILKFEDEWKFIRYSKSVRKIKIYDNEILVLGNNYLGIIQGDSIKKTIKSDFLKSIIDFTFVGENTIYCCGANGLIIKYSNDEWIKFESGVNVNLNSIFMIDDVEGWCVGNDGTILHFSDSISQDVIQREWKGFEQQTFYLNAKLVDDEYGVVAADFNGDQMIDIFTCGLYESNHLYINKGNMKFDDKAQEKGLTFSKDIKTNRELNLGACAGDFDNDGNIDLYVSSLNSKNKIYHNLGNADFIDYSEITNGVGLSNDRTNAVITGDVDNDGDLDIFICNENTTNRMYENNGAGVFKEITKIVNLSSEFGGTGASFSDIDNDGDLDLYIANWSTENKLYKNLLIEKDSLKFIDITNESGVAGDYYAKSNAVVFADIDNDADDDLFVTNRKTSNKLYINNGNGKFTDVTEDLIGRDTLKSYGAVVADFNNDGFRDLYISNVGENKLFINEGGKKFTDKSELYNANLDGYSTGVAAADFNNDKSIDLYVANYIGSSSSVLKNKSFTRDVVLLNLKGIKNNSLGIGAKVYAYKSGYLNNDNFLLNYSEIKGGSGYASMNNTDILIPTLVNKYIDIKVIFPTGEIITRDFNLSGSRITITDMQDSDGGIEITKKYFSRLFFDPHRLMKFIKGIVFIFLIGISLVLGSRKYHWDNKVILLLGIVSLIDYYILQSVFEFDNLFFSTFLPLSSVMVISILTHFYYERKRLKEHTELEKAKLRDKISRDLHDDIAATLSTVTIYLELLKKSFKIISDDSRIYFSKTETLLYNAKSSVADLIWAIKPKPEKLVNFIARLRENFIYPFKKYDIHLDINTKNIEENKVLSSVEKHNLYLIIKESLNNILKHANAENVQINFIQLVDGIQIDIIDDGIGFDITKSTGKGNGIGNIERRVKDINAELFITSGNNQGTNIKIKLE